VRQYTVKLRWIEIGWLELMLVKQIIYIPKLKGFVEKALICTAVTILISLN